MEETMTIDEIRHFIIGICDLIVEHLPQIEATRYEIRLKDDCTPVTSSDILVEQLVYNYIRMFLPSVVFIGEETFDFSSVDTDDYIVVLDPIDGTENFCSGLKEWGISFGIWKGNLHLGSCLFMPELGIRLLTGDELEPIQSRLIGMSSSMSQGILEQMQEPGEYRMMGCAVYNIYNTIKGSFRRFVNPKGAYVWDLMPGMMLALEHGCTVIFEGERYYGEFLDPTRRYRIDIKR